MESVKKQTYQNIITIVHTDDREDKYAFGDILVHTDRKPANGQGHYNLYCNKLLETIPSENGWFHFLDDDDEYFDENVIGNLVANSQENMVNVARVQRWDDVIFPKNWRNQDSFQSECFFIHAKHKYMGKWWNKRAGDHYYSKQLTEKLKINWIEDLMIAKAQKGKGRGKRLDYNDEPDLAIKAKSPNMKVDVVQIQYLRRVLEPKHLRGHAGQVCYMDRAEALRLVSKRKVMII